MFSYSVTERQPRDREKDKLHYKMIKKDLE